MTDVLGYVFYAACGFTLLGYEAYRRYWFNPNRAAVTSMACVPRRLISSVRDGEAVRLVGFLEGRESPLLTPLSDRRCIAYQVVFAIEREFGLGSPRVETQSRQISIRDDSGIAHIDAEVAEFALRLDRRWSFDRMQRSPERFESLLAAHRLSRNRFLFYRSAEFFEGVLTPNEEVAITGVARWEASSAGHESSYREAPRRLIVDATEAVPLRVSNDPRARR